MADKPRLIERAFPLKQASLDSVHEKNVRHGHISTLHIWPARRPLAACRAALIATLLPDPGTPEARQQLCEKIGGKLVKRIEKKKMPNGQTVERVKEETEGGILHWKRETENAQDLEWFRQEIRKAYGGRAPKVLDPFAGGGAIPLEAMRLGCEATAVDINPVAWFILKCTLEYPQKLAGKTHPLPEFILHDEEFMETFYKAHPHLVGRTKKTKRQIEKEKAEPKLWEQPDSGRVPKADLAWHVRAWGLWVLAQARKDLARFYPTYADFEPLDRENAKPYEKQEMRLVPLAEDGRADADALNKEFSKDYMADKRNPRWVAKPTVAYLWTRTVTCKNCRNIVPLLKTRWLCKKKDGKKRVMLTTKLDPAQRACVFGIEENVPVKGGNAAQRREHDKRIAAGTMSKAGAQCPSCPALMTMEDIAAEGRSGRMASAVTAVVVDGQNGKEYRLPTSHELAQASPDISDVTDAFRDIPFGLPSDVITEDAKRNTWCVQYGLDRFDKLFGRRQLIGLGRLISSTRLMAKETQACRYPDDWTVAIKAMLALAIDRLADYSSSGTHWGNGGEFVVSTFQRFALPVAWDYSEVACLGSTSGGYRSALTWISLVCSHACRAAMDAASPSVMRGSAIKMAMPKSVDLVLTDPPYYNAIGYSVLMDFFYVWLRRTLNGDSEAVDLAFRNPLAPKWDAADGDGELVDDASRHGGDAAASKAVYENGMARAFQACHRVLSDNGRFVVVFAHKAPDAWETLVSAIISSGFVVDGSWPIQTERASRTRSLSSAALSSSVWLVCRKRQEAARPGWDNVVMEEMRTNIGARLREYWDAGIRGPDFVWAATGPALEAYSKHPVVKKANDPGKAMEVGEFLSQVRRMVVDFVVGQVLSGDKQGADLAAADRMDAPTAYYLLHRHDFGLDEAPSGACILYATACGLSDHDLETTWDILARTGGDSGSQDENGDNGEPDPDEEGDPDVDSDSGSKVKLKTWAQRKHKSMGYEAPGGHPVPLIDRIHRLMHLWRSGDVTKVDEYLDDNGLRRQELFKRLLQSLIELSPAGSDERTLLESLSNHVQAKGATREDRQQRINLVVEE